LANIRLLSRGAIRTIEKVADDQNQYSGSITRGRIKSRISAKLEFASRARSTQEEFHHKGTKNTKKAKTSGSVVQRW